MAQHKWTFKSHFRREAYGWKGTILASQRMKQAISEIRKVAKTNPSLAGEGVIELFNRLYPAVEHIDSSSGALGNALNRTIEALTPILLQAPWDMDTRDKWLEVLYEAIIEDGWNIFHDLEDQWGELCVYPALAHRWADRLLPVVKAAWSSDNSPFITGDDICASCLLYTARYKELYELVYVNSRMFWFHCKFWAKALEKQGKLEEALTYAEYVRTQQRTPNEDRAIDHFCETILVKMGKVQEAYEKYGLNMSSYGTYVNIYRNICKKYPTIDKKKILSDCIDKSGQKGKWFAAAKDAGYLDIALECAQAGNSNPYTLLRATRDFRDKDPEFAVKVGVEAIVRLLTGDFAEPITASDIDTAYCSAAAVARNANLLPWFSAELSKRIFPNSYRISPAFKKDIMNRLQGISVS